MIKVLFVCSGNICRSPMADGVFQDMVKKAALSDKIQVDSAGTGSWHVGERPQPGTMRIFQEHGIDYKGRARQIDNHDLNNFDYVLAMDYSNLRSLKNMRQGKAEVRMFTDYAINAGERIEAEVPDPYYNGKFDIVYDMVKVGSEALLDHIRKTHNL